jgi:hypothetical protein
MESARWFHAAVDGKKGRVQLLPDCVPGLASAPAPGDPEDEARPGEVLDPEELLADTFAATSPRDDPHAPNAMRATTIAVVSTVRIRHQVMPNGA